MADKSTTEYCCWNYDEDDEYWDTGCGEAFCVMEGTPKDNRMKFCPYCGRRIQQESE